MEMKEIEWKELNREKEKLWPYNILTDMMNLYGEWSKKLIDIRLERKIPKTGKDYYSLSIPGLFEEVIRIKDSSRNLSWSKG